MAQKFVQLYGFLSNKPACKDRNSAITTQEALGLITTDDDGKITTEMPFRPKGGEVYVFRPETTTMANDWRSDGHKWVNQGTSSLPRKKPLIKKKYFYISTNDGPNTGFRKDVYHDLTNSPSTFIIHYIGNEKLSVPGPHGNNLRQSKLFFRTKPSVLNELQDKVSTREAHKVYKDEISTKTTGHETVAKPRNVKQLQNIRAKIKQDERLSRDAILNAHDIAYDSENFMWHISSYPDLVVVCGAGEMLMELDRVLRLKSRDQLLTYDTTFTLGEFYVSPLLFRQTCFEESPVMPGLFLIHERKKHESHKILFDVLKKQVKSITRKVVIATDNEEALVKAAEQYMTRISCRRHTSRQHEGNKKRNN